MGLLAKLFGIEEKPIGQLRDFRGDHHFYAVLQLAYISNVPGTAEVLEIREDYLRYRYDLGNNRTYRGEVSLRTWGKR